MPHTAMPATYQQLSCTKYPARVDIAKCRQLSVSRSPCKIISMAAYLQLHTTQSCHCPHRHSPSNTVRSDVVSTRLQPVDSHRRIRGMTCNGKTPPIFCMNMGNGRLLTTYAARSVDERAVVCFQQTCDVGAVSRSGHGSGKTNEPRPTNSLAGLVSKEQVR